MRWHNQAAPVTGARTTAAESEMITMRKLLAASLLALAVVVSAPSVTAHAATRTPVQYSAVWADNSALNWAETQVGAWYRYGGTGPYWSGYDCSGLVYAAYRHVGISLPRTTYEMLGSAHLRRTYSPQRGDLAFYGSGHVEIVTGWGSWVTFGAEEPGTQVGWHRASAWWHPTMYFHVSY